MELERSVELVGNNKRSEMDSSKVKYWPEDNNNNNINKNKIQRRRRRRRRSVFLPKFGCFKSNDHPPTTMLEKPDVDGISEMESAFNIARDGAPTHLVITVNGIIGSAQNWRFAAKQFVKNYPQDVIVHCSECNSSLLTFDGVDVMGNRLAEEVISVIKRHSDLRKISFIGHSLGGLVARYAIAKLYRKELTRDVCQQDGESRVDGPGDQCLEEKLKGKIAGLEPVNFITSATPHLGSRGHKQVPAFCGFYTLEKAAFQASWCLGRTGKHLFLADTDNGKPPLLLQMVNDSEDLPFMSALQSFKRRVAYANARFDHLVGWSTSSLRRRNELPKRQHLARNDKYPHIVNVEAATQEEASPEAEVNGYQSDDIEEMMIRGLTKVSWERVDVSFSGSKQKYLAHSTIQASKNLLYQF
ncbi:hypothetical protein LguiB_019853 [Lonicera macranthoides]